MAKIKIIQRSKAIATQRDNGEWTVTISVYVGARMFNGDIVVPFGLNCEETAKEIAEEFNSDG